MPMTRIAPEASKGGVNAVEAFEYCFSLVGRDSVASVRDRDQTLPLSHGCGDRDRTAGGGVAHGWVRFDKTGHPDGGRVGPIEY